MCHRYTTRRIWSPVIFILFINSYVIPVANNNHESCECQDFGNPLEYPKCRYEEKQTCLVCWGALENYWKLKENNVASLTFCNLMNSTFDPTDLLLTFSSLRKLRIVNGNLTNLSSTFSGRFQLLSEINITNTKLKGIPDYAFRALRSLTVLDLRNNDLLNFNVNAINGSRVTYIFLAGNHLECTEDTAWILDSNNQSIGSRIIDKETLRCFSPHGGRPLIPVMEIIMTLKEECKKTMCHCELVYAVNLGNKQSSKQLRAFVSLDCSYRGLNEMPEFLPDNTTTLRLTGNKITDLTPLIKNSFYKSVLDLYLDDNLVESIAQLEGSFWLDHFRLLSVRDNLLTDLPTYALENVLLQSENAAASLYLGKNPWKCDCLFTPGFQDLLIRHGNLVKDINDVKCGSSNDNKNFNKQIRDLSRAEICRTPDEESWIHPLNILNVILALLIFLILGNLLYDYWHFKTTGKLPWIITKIP